MSRRFALVLVLASCNRIYDLDDTQLRDAPGPDAAPTCDRDPLVFRPQVQQAVFQPCTHYSTSDATGRALALCPSQGAFVVAEGPIDDALVEVAVERKPDHAMLSVALAPEGDRAIVQHATLTGVPVFSVHVREAAGWKWSYDLPAADYDDSVGTPSSRPGARLMHARPNAGVVDELVEDTPDTWRVLRSYTAQELGTFHLYGVFNLTADGRHVVFSGADTPQNTNVYHAVRTGIDERFGRGVPVAGIPRTVEDAFMTDDCGRVYFSGLSSIFYARQQ